MLAESSGSQTLSEAPSSESVISVDWPRCSKAMGELPQAEVGSVRLSRVLRFRVNAAQSFGEPLQLRVRSSFGWRTADLCFEQSPTLCLTSSGRQRGQDRQMSPAADRHIGMARGKAPECGQLSAHPFHWS
jgi:hypothetical protein